jgi:hypothetical protein
MVRRVWDVEEPMARASDPETSHAAAASVRNKSLVQERIMSELIRRGPMTDEELACVWAGFEDRVLMCSPSGLRTRRSELVTRGEVTDSGARVKMESGRWAIKWKAVSH